jgi:prefoldin subunit 5
MTSRQNENLERSIGRIEATLEHLTTTLKRVEDSMSASDRTRETILDRLTAMENHAETMKAVAEEFATLRQTIRDGKMQARGMLIGVGVVAGAGGATLATAFKSAWAWFTGVAP